MSTQSNQSVKRLVVAAAFMAINVVFSSFGIPVPGGRIYLCDAVICTAAILFDPVYALAIGGIGALLGDMFFYPAAMFVSLLVHGLQATTVSICTHFTFKKHPLLGMILGGVLGCAIMTMGYTLGKVFVYGELGKWMPALITAPFELLQSAVGTVIAITLCYSLKLRDKLKLDI